MYLIGTAGPNIKEKAVLKAVIDNGINVLRFNYAHGSEEEFKEFLECARNIDKNIEILLDVSGSKIRVSNKFEYIYKIYDGEEIIFCGEDKYNDCRKRKLNNKIIPLNIKDKVLRECKSNLISIKDNTMNFKIIREEEQGLKAKTINGGIIRKGKGCNIKGLDRSRMKMNTHDKRAVLCGINNGINMFCQSFIETSNDIKEFKDYILNNEKNNVTPIIFAKIETLKGIENIDEIIKECDGIIIGRGDLIPETSLEDAPIYEDKIISTAIKYENKAIIVATHLLDSMKNGKKPLICETECIYNFVKKGINGFLLAGETSVGRAPVKCVKFLNTLINKYSNKV